MIAVENMDMPDRCFECFFCIDFECVAADMDKVPKNNVPLDRKKPEWCPLRKVSTAATIVGYSRNDPATGKKIAQEQATRKIFEFLKNEKVITISDPILPRTEKLYLKAQLSVVMPPVRESGGKSDGT